MGGVNKHFSYSRVKTWRDCHQKHYYRYVERLEKIVPTLALKRGEIYHAMLEAYLKGDSWEKVLDGYSKEYDKLSEEEKKILGDLPHTLEKIMRGYIKLYGNDGLKYPVVEEEFNCAIFMPSDLEAINKFLTSLGQDTLTDIRFVGKIDAIAQNDKTWIVEHKTVSKIPDESMRLYDFQTVLYTYAIETDSKFENFKPDGILWDYIRTKIPTVPEVLKKGGLSKAKNIDTDYDTYYEAIISHDENPVDYADILNKLKEKGNTFYRRNYVLLASANMRRVLLDDFRRTILEIIINGDTDKIKNLDRFCNTCPYEEICQAELSGLDVDFIKSKNYKKVEKEEI